MGNYDFNTHSQFHKDYLKKMFVEKRMKYAEGAIQHVQEEYYLRELQNRIQREPTQLPSFQEFMAFCDLVRTQLQ